MSPCEALPREAGPGQPDSWRQLAGVHCRHRLAVRLCHTQWGGCHSGLTVWLGVHPPHLPLHPPKLELLLLRSLQSHPGHPQLGGQQQQLQGGCWNCWGWRWRELQLLCVFKHSSVSIGCGVCLLHISIGCTVCLLHISSAPACSESSLQHDGDMNLNGCTFEQPTISPGRRAGLTVEPSLSNGGAGL